MLTKTVALEKGDSDIRSEALLREAITTLEDFLVYLPAESGEILLSARSIKNPGQAADFIAASAFVKFEDKQRVLNVFEPLARLETVNLDFQKKYRKSSLKKLVVF